MKWQDITIRQFQELARIEKEGGLDANLAKVAYLEGKTIEELDALNLGQLNELMAKYAPLFKDMEPEGMLTRWEYKGTLYKLIGNIRDMNAGQYNELVHFSKGRNGKAEIVEVLHLLMATLVKPYKKKWGIWRGVKKDHAKVAEDMLEAPFYLAMKSAVFFCKLYYGSLENTKGYFQSLLKETKAESQRMGSLRPLDGYTTPKR